MLKTRLPPNLSVRTPIGTLAIEPSNTGVASNNPTAVEDKLNSTFRYAAKGEKSVQPAKHVANANVASISTLVFPLGVCTDSFIKKSPKFELTSGFSLRLENKANSGFSPEPKKIMAKAGFIRLHNSAMNGGVKSKHL